MAGFLRVLLQRLTRGWRGAVADGGNVQSIIDVQSVQSSDGFVGECDVVILAVEAVETVDVVVAEPRITVASPVKRFRLATRLRAVAKLKSRKKGATVQPVGKARANLKPKPVVVGRVAKRTPDVFATKVKRTAPKKPTTKIFIAKRPKKTAEILIFPVRKPTSFAPRHRLRAA